MQHAFGRNNLTDQESDSSEPRKLLEGSLLSFPFNSLLILPILLRTFLATPQITYADDVCDSEKCGQLVHALALHRGQSQERLHAANNLIQIRHVFSVLQ